MSNEQSKKQVLSYNFHKNKWAIAALLLFIIDVSCVLLIGVIDSLIVLAIMAVLSIACLFCALHIKETSKSEELYVIENPANLDVPKLIENMHDSVQALGVSGSSVDDDVECYLFSEDMNYRFVMKPLWAKVSKEPYALPEQVLPFVAYLKDYRNRSLAKSLAMRPDKEVAGLASDITVDMFDCDHPEVEVDIVTRYSVQVTDDAFNKLIVNKKKISNKVVFDGRQLAVSNGHLEGFSDSKICNEMDIHSIIVSSDGYVMVARATEKHPLCPGKIVSSAACSLLPDEIEERPLQESMISSIHSKIRFLYDIPADVEIHSSFCGMTRMLPRGGAPEFYCITLIDMTKDEIIAAHKDDSCVLVPEGYECQVVFSKEGTAASLRKAAQSIACKPELSLSAAALFKVMDTSLANDEVAYKILSRIGIADSK